MCALNIKKLATALTSGTTSPEVGEDANFIVKKSLDKFETAFKIQLVEAQRVY